MEASPEIAQPPFRAVHFEAAPCKTSPLHLARLHAPRAPSAAHRRICRPSAAAAPPLPPEPLPCSPCAPPRTP